MDEAIKFEICCAARILFRAGLSVGNAGHLSFAIGGNRVLVNRFGPSFATLIPADIITVDFDGHVIEHDPSVSPYVNDTIALHAMVHRESPHLFAAIHTHPPATVTWSAFRKLPEIFDQESCLLTGDIGIVEEEYEGREASQHRMLPLARKLGEFRVAILPNHGAMTTGPNLRVALVAMLLLEGACLRSIAVAAAAHATGFTPQPIGPEHALQAKKEMGRIPYLDSLWEDLLRRLRQTDPDLFAFSAIQSSNRG